VNLSKQTGANQVAKKIDYLSDHRFAYSVLWYRRACKASRDHSTLAANALAAYGDHGPQISGCVRSHFPEHIKNALRTYTRRVTAYSDRAFALRPPYVRAHTMRHVARLVAAEYGSGFYGPQPYRAAV